VGDAKTIFGSQLTAVITRQRPGTAKGLIFLTLEDETGHATIVGLMQAISDARCDPSSVHAMMRQ
jgi:hypothetical protein